ncbi:hypothetical protein ABEF95_005644 [Exophiala dermatitidis]
MSATAPAVAIVGGGPTGLAASILLSLCKIPHVLFERYPSTSIHPKACGYNHRTLEIFRLMGIEKDVIEQRAPKTIDGQTAWYTSFGPNGKEIVIRNAWGGGIYQKEYGQVSPCSYSTMPQIRLEPILQKRALELNPDGILYNTEVVKVEEYNNHVAVTYQRKGQPSPETIRVKYCIAADGGRRLTDDLGIGWEGERDITDMVSAHVRAPISQHHPDIRNFITWFVNPKLGGSIGTGYLYHLGPYPLDPNSEEWLFACALSPTDPKRFDEDAMLQRMHDTLQIPGLKEQTELLSISHWYVNALCAKQYRSKGSASSKGRVFLVGDAAHRIPPWGALGLNTGIQDVHNLVWKLNFAINGLPPALYGSNTNARSENPINHDALLDTYDVERRPVGQRVRTTSLHNLRAHSLVMDTALGLSPENSEADNVAAMDSFLDHAAEGGGDEGHARREAIQQAQKILDGEFHALGAEIGWFYPSLDLDGEGQATNHDGQLDDAGNLDMLRYHPSTIPGHHLPHVWLERDRILQPQRGEKEKKQRVSTRDLVRYDGFILLTSAPELWQQNHAVDRNAGSGLGGLVTVIEIADVAGTSDEPAVDNKTPNDNDEDDDDDRGASGHTSYRDIEGKWKSLRGIEHTGAILVRPDGIVVWRAREFDPSRHSSPGVLRDVILRSLKPT